MKLYTFLVVTAIAGISDANQIEHCEDFQSTTNATFGDLADNNYYVKYLTINIKKANYVVKNILDGNIFYMKRNENSNNFTIRMRIVRRDRSVENEVSSIIIDEEKQNKASGELGTMYLMDFKPKKYALVYNCKEIPERKSLEGEKIGLFRMLLTTDLANDITPALEEDRKYNFDDELVELPFNHTDLFTGTNKEV